MGTPGLNVDPLTIEEDATALMPASTNITMGNTGNFPARYTATVVYDEMDLLSADFNSGIPVDWTIVNNGTNNVTWTDTTNLYGQFL